MVIHINKNSEIPVFQQLIQVLKLKIASGELKAGDKLPSIREMAVSLSLNLHTVMKSYQELEREGLLENKKGKGFFVKEFLNDFAINKIKEEILFQKIDEIVNITKLFGIEKDKLFQTIEKRF